MNSSRRHPFSKFYTAVAALREAGDCSATVSHGSDAASICGVQRQPELLWFHLDHSSLPWIRMLKLTGLSFSSHAHRLSPSSLSTGPLLAVSLSHWGLSLFLCSVSFFFPVALISRLFSIVRFLHSSPLWLHSFLSFYHFHLLAKEENGDWEWSRHSGIRPLLKSGHFSGTVQLVPVCWI